MRVDIMWFGSAESQTFWPLGQTWPAIATPRGLHDQIRQSVDISDAEAWLFWDSALGNPDPTLVMEVLRLSGDAWHAGLRLGMVGMPGLIDFVNPTWMLNRDPDSDIEATSWRLSLRACLVRTEVLHQMKGVCPEFQTLEGASLEMGHRYITSGVFTRYVPRFVLKGESKASIALPFEDELRFVYYRFGLFWSRWALARALLTGYVSPRQAFYAWRQVIQKPRPSEPSPFKREENLRTVDSSKAQVSVLIPTLDRYPYLRKLLSQLRYQTVKPFQIIVADQTPRERRDTTLVEDFGDLPLVILYFDKPGQCSSRNVGLKLARGEYVFFADDDIELSETLIENHLRNLQCFGEQVSSGVADEIGVGPISDDLKYIRVSDVFPLGNTLIRRDVLHRSGLLDMAYERGARADGDLGMRVYLSGTLMVLNPDISVFHHRAPMGGLRSHKARVITYASSRSSLVQRHLLQTTEIYLAKRYFSVRQVREMLLQRIFGTFSIRGSTLRKVSKVAISLLLLPHTMHHILARGREATQMMQKYPQIPVLSDRQNKVSSGLVHKTMEGE